MPNNQDDLNINITVDTDDLKKSFKKITSTTQDFYTHMLALDEEYRKDIRKQLTKELVTYTHHNKKIMGMLRKKTAAQKVFNRAAGLKGGVNGTGGSPGGAGAPPPPGGGSKTPATSGFANFVTDISKQIGKARMPKSFMSKGSEVEKAADLGKGLGNILNTLGGEFEGVSGLLGKFAGGITGATASVITWMIAADSAQKDMQKKFVSGTGLSGVGSTSDLKNLTSFTTSWQQAQNSITGFGKSMRLTNAETEEVTRSLLANGVSLKSLAGDQYAFRDAQDTAAAAAKAWGMSMEESGKLYGDWVARSGFGSQKMNKGFDILAQNIKKSNMTANTFLSTIQSVTAQFGMFMDQTIEFSKILGKLGSSGMTQNLAKGMTEALGKLGGTSRKQGMTQYGIDPKAGAALFGKQIELINKRIEQIYRIDQGKGTEEDKAAGAGSTEELYRLFDRLGDLTKDLSSKLPGSAMGKVDPMLKLISVVEGVAKTEGKQLLTAKDLYSFAQNNEKVMLKAAQYDIDEQTFSDSMKALAIISEKDAKGNILTLDAIKNSNDLLKDAADSQKDSLNYKQAADLASETTTVFSGSGDMMNTLLVKSNMLLQNIFEGVGKVAEGIWSKLPGSETISKFFESSKKSASEEAQAIQDELQLLGKAQQDAIKQRVTEHQKTNSDAARIAAQAAGATFTPLKNQRSLAGDAAEAAQKRAIDSHESAAGGKPTTVTASVVQWVKNFGEEVSNFSDAVQQVNEIDEKYAQAMDQIAKKWAKTAYVASGQMAKDQEDIKKGIDVDKPSIWKDVLGGTISDVLSGKDNPVSTFIGSHLAPSLYPENKPIIDKGGAKQSGPQMGPPLPDQASNNVPTTIYATFDGDQLKGIIDKRTYENAKKNYG